MTRAIIIDPHKRTVEERELPLSHDSHATHIREIIGDFFALACAIPIPGNEPDMCYVDDNGLFKPNQHHFVLLGWGHQPYAGIGVILGSGRAGETIPARISVDEVRRRLMFQED